jgi:hypothetical protein
VLFTDLPVLHRLMVRLYLAILVSMVARINKIDVAMFGADYLAGCRIGVVEHGRGLLPHKDEPDIGWCPAVRNHPTAKWAPTHIRIVRMD